METSHSISNAPTYTLTHPALHLPHTGELGALPPDEHRALARRPRVAGGGRRRRRDARVIHPI
eukprot:750875-Prymnesium_polylepis.2